MCDTPSFHCLHEPSPIDYLEVSGQAHNTCCVAVTSLQWKETSEAGYKVAVAAHC